MSADENDLIPEFKAKVDSALAQLAKEGLTFKPYYTLRSPVEQAGFWRQSRSESLVQQKIGELRAAGCDFIVDCFNKAGPKTGPWVTNALPGESWHQYGEAVDCYLVDASGNHTWESPAYRRFGVVGDANAMWWGGHFKDPDNDHWQNRQTEPSDQYGSIKQINDALEQRWGSQIASRDSTPVILPRVVMASPAGYRPDPSALPLLGSFANLIPPSNPNRQDFVHPPRYLGPVQTPAGRVLLMDSALELDTDGWLGDKGNSNWQSGTSLHYSDRVTPLDANRVPYFVLPLPVSWPTAFGIGLGDYAAVLLKGKMSFGIFGDFGPHSKIGEGSIELLRRLGQERIRADGSVQNAGTDPGVLSIIFPGSGSEADRSSEASLLAAISRRGADLFESIKP